jgi:acetoin utilization deacetylase AcuC-like enzyme
MKFSDAQLISHKREVPMISVFYRPEQSCTAAVDYSPSAGKPELVVKDWVSRPEIAKHIQIQSFSPVTNTILCGAHDQAYVLGVLSGRVANGFGSTSSDIAASLRYTVGSVVAAALYVIQMPSSGIRTAVSPTSGFHHAGYAFGGGFCTFNGLMVAAVHVHALGLADRILIVDMDQHCGNGTDDIIEALGMDYVDHITATRSYRTAKQALACADLTANTEVQSGLYDLVLYQAGADMHVDDPLGGLLTTKQMAERDRLVFDGCAKCGVPLVWCLAGGYQRDSSDGISPVLDLHRQTLNECIGAVNASMTNRPDGSRSFKIDS